MSRFVQLHLLTSHAPSNLNRDDTGRPKTALVGNANRLRISSQSNKRAWRTSDMFQEALGSHIGTRTKLLGIEIHERLLAGGIADKSAREWARAIAGQFGKLKSDKKPVNNSDLEIEQLAHVSTEELKAVRELEKKLIERKSEPTEEELKLLTLPRGSVDIAMFGRMLADVPEFNIEAAVQVSHAITVHKAAVEDDYFSAVDDLQKAGDSGASHIGERGYGAGLFYIYICIDRELLYKNLGGDQQLAARALTGLVNAITKVSPTGMQNSFASRAYASFVMAEKGDQQPRSLAQAYLKPVKPYDDQNMLDEAVKALVLRCDNFDKVYGACADARYLMNAEAAVGSLSELVSFVAG
jgi:CRISPR system Cascade subunit CasC